MDNIEAQNEEIEALQSIFGEECVSVIEECVIEDRVVIIRLAERSRLRATLSKAYPEEKPPEVVLIGSRHLEEQNDRVKSKAQTFWAETNDVMLFQLVEWVNETFFSEDDENSEEENESKIENDVKVENYDDILLQHGEPITDRRSTFQAHVSVVTSVEKAVRALRKLYASDRKIQRATHNIWAYRIHDTSTNTVYSDNDDDGETAAGRRLALLLDTMDVSNAMVIVTRWYGGIHLGPARFRHINNVARELIERSGLSRRSERRKKKGKGSSG